MIVVAVTLPVVLALAGVVGLLVPLSCRRIAEWLALLGTGVAWLCSVVLLLGPKVVASGVWANFGDITVQFAVKVDGVAASVAFAVTTVAFCVQLYSAAYLVKDDRYTSYAAQISLFTAAMLLVVVADDLIMMLVGWELMGICSYLLIGHDRRVSDAPAAAVKAFLVTRVGDVGFVLGIVLLAAYMGTFRIGEIIRGVPELPVGVVAAAGVLILAGAIGKSAQFPLHTWLPDAMAGPTPVSALIHSATMVAAGAYVLVRLLPLYTATTVLPVVIACVAAITMILSACVALATDDLKRVFAWSTISQVAYMFGGAAVADSQAAVGHLLSHAGLKALLFLCAGVIIAMVGTNSMTAMGGLRKGAPITFWTMTIGMAALAGIPLTSGFWTKEAVLGAAQNGSASGIIVFVSGTITAGLTAAYVTRAWLRVFGGRPRKTKVTVVDPGPKLTIPLLILSGLTLLWSLGLTLYYVIALFTGATTPLQHPIAVLLVVAVTVLGIWWTATTWVERPAEDPARALGRWRNPFARGFYLDDIQSALIVKPTIAFASAIKRADNTIIDGAVERLATVTTATSADLELSARRGLPRHLTSAAGGIVIIAVFAAAILWGTQ